MKQEKTELNTLVRGYWEKEPCGTGADLTRGFPEGSLEWYQQIEEHRYRVEPFIHAIAQFTRHRGKRLLEIGVGAGTDHLQWARAGLDCYGVDLTDAAIETTRKHLAHYGLGSKLQRTDAERLPFEDGFFDLVYSWGVIHHSESPGRIIGEVRRVLKPGGRFIGMMYGRRSPLVFKAWVRHALLKGRPWLSFSEVVWNHVESIGTKAYTAGELRVLFREFSAVEVIPVITSYDRSGWPKWLSCFFPDKWGWFMCLRALK
jgi:ubiquinone/menaquinone biosynthesis C-methylase UbiE